MATFYHKPLMVPNELNRHSTCHAIDPMQHKYGQIVMNCRILLYFALQTDFIFLMSFCDVKCNHLTIPNTIASSPSFAVCCHLNITLGIYIRFVFCSVSFHSILFVHLIRGESFLNGNLPFCKWREFILCLSPGISYIRSFFSSFIRMSYACY